MGSSGSDSSEDAPADASSTATARTLANALAPIFATIAEQCLAAHEAMCAIAERAPTTTLARRRTKGKRVDDGDGTLTKKRKREMRAPRQPTAFNLFMKAEVTRVRAERPELGPKEVFTECAARWKANKAAASGEGGVGVEGGMRGSLAGVSTPAPVKEKRHKEKSHKKEKKHRDK